MRSKKGIRLASIVLEFCFILWMSMLFHYSMNYGLRFVLLYMMIQAMFGHYRVATLLIWEEIELLVKSHICFYFASLLLIPRGNEVLQTMFTNFIITGLAFLFAVIIARMLHIAFRRHAKENVLIIGTGKEAVQLFEVCRDNRFALKDVKGFIDANDEVLFPNIHQEVLVEENVYPIKDLKNIIEKLDIDSVIIGIPNISRSQMNHLMQILFNKVEKISYLPQTASFVTFDTKVQDFDGTLVVSTAKGKADYMSRFIKRTIDIIAGLCGVLLLLPLSIIIRIKNHKSGDYEPIMFEQERIGKDGKKFIIKKYRTMVPDAEALLDKLMEEDSAIREEYQTNKKLRNDPRVTEAGKFLRRTSLDEFPQFINVLKGEMSMVGPRPYLPREMDEMGMYYQSVIGCKPGITGMWQSHGRNDVGFEERLQMDDYYYRNWSIWLDITILIKTVKMVLKGSGAL